MVKVYRLFRGFDRGIVILRHSSEDDSLFPGNYGDPYHALEEVLNFLVKRGEHPISVIPFKEEGVEMCRIVTEPIAEAVKPTGNEKVLTQGAVFAQKLGDLFRE